MCEDWYTSIINKAKELDQYIDNLEWISFNECHPKNDGNYFVIMDWSNVVPEKVLEGLLYWGENKWWYAHPSICSNAFPQPIIAWKPSYVSPPERKIRIEVINDENHA